MKTIGADDPCAACAAALFFSVYRPIFNAFLGLILRITGEKYNPAEEEEWSINGVKRTEKRPSLSIPFLISSPPVVAFAGAFAETFAKAFADDVPTLLSSTSTAVVACSFVGVDSLTPPPTGGTTSVLLAFDELGPGGTNCAGIASSVVSASSCI